MLLVGVGLVWLLCYLITLNVLSLMQHLIINDRISILINEIIYSFLLIHPITKLLKSCRGMSGDFEYFSQFIISLMVNHLMLHLMKKIK